jgi:ribosomal protein L24
VLQNQLPAQPTFEPPPETESIEIGDYVDVFGGHYAGKCGVIAWVSPGETSVYLRVDDKICGSSGPAMIKVLSIWIRRTRLAPTIKYTKDKGYDVGCGDFVNVARGPEYQTTGVVQNVDFPSACLTLLSQTDSSLVSPDHLNSNISNRQQVNVPMRFVVKTRNATVDTFKNVIGKEVFVIQGQHKGYRATLYDIGREHCSVALPGQKRIMLKLSEVVTR